MHTNIQINGPKLV